MILKCEKTAPYGAIIFADGVLVGAITIKAKGVYTVETDGRIPALDGVYGGLRSVIRGLQSIEKARRKTSDTFYPKQTQHRGRLPLRMLISPSLIRRTR